MAESDQDVRGYLVMLLGAMGHSASGVGSIGALSHRVNRRMPDAVLCDARLPDGDGIEACRRLKLLRPAPTIVIMAWDPVWAASARQAALGPVLLKPFSPTELRDAFTFVLFSLLKATLARAVSDLRKQNDELRIRVEDSSAAPLGKGEE